MLAHLLFIRGSQGVCLQRDEEGDDAFCAGTSGLWARCCCRLGGVVLRDGTVEHRQARCVSVELSHRENREHVHAPLAAEGPRRDLSVQALALARLAARGRNHRCRTRQEGPCVTALRREAGESPCHWVTQAEDERRECRTGEGAARWVTSTCLSATRSDLRSERDNPPEDPREQRPLSRVVIYAFVKALCCDRCVHPCPFSFDRLDSTTKLAGQRAHVHALSLVRLPIHLLARFRTVADTVADGAREQLALGLLAAGTARLLFSI